MTNPTILPCPFCGQPPNAFGYGKHTYAISCECDVSPHIEVTGTENAERRSKDIWNKREACTNGLNEIWEILHADGYTVVEVETMYAEWIYYNQK